jgi:hypothetical protein
LSDPATPARHAPLAAALTGLTPAAATARLIERDVVLDWSPRIESTVAGAALIRTTANLVVRFCPSLRIRPSTKLAGSLATIMKGIDSSAEPDRSPSRDALHIHLGGDAAADVTASASGWVAITSGFGDVLPPLDDDGGLAIGAHGAAALAASQVFARALPLDPRRAGPSPMTHFSLLDYRADGVNPLLDRLPAIKGALLAGSGAVGEACVDTLVGIAISGDLAVADSGFVDDPTNLNRSVLANERDLVEVTPKVELAVRRARGTELIIDPLESPIAGVITDVESGARPMPHIVLSALDNRPARWELQSLWPDLVLEGATGGSMAQIFRHAHGEETACLRCLHPDDDGHAGPSYLDRMAELTGLATERLRVGLDDAGDRLTKADLADATPAARELLAQHVGRDVCGFLSEVERLLPQRTNVPQLSVAFSSYLAGVFLAGELVKASSGLRSSLVGRFQMDPLAILTPDGPFLQRASRTCFCQQRRRTVTSIRRRRTTMRQPGLLGQTGSSSVRQTRH